MIRKSGGPPTGAAPHDGTARQGVGNAAGEHVVPGVAAPPPAASPARVTFAQHLAARPLLFDGAMGTLLFSRGIPQRASLDELVLTRSDLVREVHQEYIGAGADAIETCSFGANRLRLEAFGLEREVGRLNRRAAQLAREARDIAGRDVLVAGSIGPLARPVRDPTRLRSLRSEDLFREQIEGLLEGGVDLLALETFSRLDELLQAIAAARGLSDLPLVAQMTFGDDLVAIDGTSPEVAARAIREAGADAAGVNCGVGPEICLQAVRRMAGENVAPLLSILPNAGLPRRVEGQFVYAADPEYFASAVPRFLSAGARIVGGCCGTTPAHIAAMRAEMDRHAAPDTGAETGRPEPRARRATPPSSLREAEAPRTAQSEPPTGTQAPLPTGLAQRLADGRFVLSVEIDPPRSVRMERTLQAAQLLKDAGADLVNISDSAMARVRMGAMAVAFAIERDVGLETLVHLTTRDRNLMALESELLGAHALGVRNILALTGDPPRLGEYPAGSGVWDVDSTGLVAILRRLNRGEDQAGSPIGGPAGFTIACALDPTASDLDRELERLQGKVEAGADLIMTQPIYDAAQWERLLERAAAHWGGPGLPRPVLLGILPLHSGRHAEFLHNEVPGITIPERVRTAMRASGERGTEVGLEMSLDLVEHLRDSVQGTYIMPSFGRYELAAELVRRIRARGRPTIGAGKS